MPDILDLASLPSKQESQSSKDEHLFDQLNAHLSQSNTSLNFILAAFHFNTCLKILNEASHGNKVPRDIIMTNCQKEIRTYYEGHKRLFYPNSVIKIAGQAYQRWQNNGGHQAINLDNIADPKLRLKVATFLQTHAPCCMPKTQLRKMGMHAPSSTSKLKGRPISTDIKMC